MNWWMKVAMPLPAATGVPSDGDQRMTRSLFDGFPQSEADEIEQQHGPLNFLGHGTSGFAYDTPSGDVVKVTADGSEAEAAQKLMQQPCPCVVGIKGLKKLPESNGQYGRSYSKLVLERATLFDHRQRVAADMLLRYKEGLTLPTLPQIYRHQYYEVPPEQRIVVEEMYPKMQAFFACLKSSDFRYNDLNYSNVGFNSKGDIVILDLGGIRPRGEE